MKERIRPVMLTCLPRVGVLFCLLVSPALAAVGEPQGTFSAEDYTKIVVDYMEGNYQNAARALAGVPTKELEAAIEAYRETVIHDSHVKAALLLHTEVVVWTDRDEPFHIRKARAWMRELDAYRRRPFEKNWFLVLGYFYMISLDLEAQPTLEAAASVFPNDVDILLALGTWKETAGWMRRDMDLLEEAEAVYRDILQKEPEMSEAMVRMGRVLALLDREEEALRYLERGLDPRQDPALRFAALLTSGDIYWERGDPAKAIECYRAAVDLDPGCQAAVVALSHALHESGDAGRSYEMVYEFFIGKSTTTEEVFKQQGEFDLWWRYSLRHSNRLNSLLKELRKEVRQ
jgi:tetratricopeptide (TPR) repeat protein